MENEPKEDQVAQIAESTHAQLASRKEATAHVGRRFIDLMVSWTAAIMAIALLAIGGAAVYGGNFALDNVRDRLEPQNITFPPAEAMSPAEKADLGEFAGTTVDTGAGAEAYSRYIGGHLAEVNDGATYSETSTASRAEGISDEERAELSAKADTLFRGETLRAILLNAYGWWTVGVITMWVGIGAIFAGALLAVFVGLGFRHARKVSGQDS